jgi:pimeloyl-ACP methyl ester carboxylesterase
MRVPAALAAILCTVAACAGAATPPPSRAPTPGTAVTSAPPPSQPSSLMPIAPSPSPSSAQTPVDGDFSGNVDIAAGTSFHLVCVGSGSPTVILIHGHGGSTADWQPVLDRLDGVAHTCAVDRIGAGDSSPATEDRTTSAIADDLHALLQNAGIATPVVLVGHSIAGFDLRLHAGRYPEDVAGMLFVDPSTVGQQASMLAALPSPSSSEPFGVSNVRAALEDGFPAPSWTSERYDIAGSEADVATVTSFGDLPVIVLSAGSGDISVPEPTRTAILDAWYAQHDKLVAMSTNGRREVVDRAGHFIQVDRPDAVVAAIIELVQGARGR